MTSVQILEIMLPFTLAVIIAIFGSAYAFYNLLHNLVHKDINALKEGLNLINAQHREDVKRMDDHHREDISKMDEKLVKMDEKWERLFGRLLIGDNAAKAV